MKIEKGKNIEKIPPAICHKKENKQISQNQEENTESTSQTPNNPDFYSSYLGINKKISSQETTEDRKNYLAALKKSDGTALIDKVYFQLSADNEQNENIRQIQQSLQKVCENPEIFKQYLDTINLKRSDGSKIIDEDSAANVLKYASNITDEAKELVKTLAEEKFPNRENYCLSNWFLEAILSTLTPENVKDMTKIIFFQNKNGEYIFRNKNILNQVSQAPEQRKLVLKYAPLIEENIPLNKNKKHDLISLFGYDRDENYYQNFLKLSGIKINGNPIFNMKETEMLCSSSTTPERISNVKDVISVLSRKTNENFEPVFDTNMLYDISFYLARNDLNIDPKTFTGRIINLADMKDENSRSIWKEHLAEIAGNEKLYNNAMTYTEQLLDTAYNELLTSEKFHYVPEIFSSFRESWLFNTLELSENKMNKFISLSKCKDREGNAVFITPDFIKELITQNDVDIDTIKSNLNLLFNHPEYSKKFFPEHLTAAICLDSKFIERVFELKNLTTPNGTKIFPTMILENKFFTNDEVFNNVKKYLPQFSEGLIKQNPAYDWTFSQFISKISETGEIGFKNAIELDRLTTPKGTKIFPGLLYFQPEFCNDNELFCNIKKYLPQFSEELLKKNKNNKNICSFINYIKKLNQSGEEGFKKAIEFQKILENEGKIENYSFEDLSALSGLSTLYKTTNINELSLNDKKEALRSLVATNTNLFNISQNLKEDFPLLPKNKDEYCAILQNLVKSMGIETKPVSEKQLKKFDKDIKEFSDLLQNKNIKDFEITQEISTKSLIETINKHTSTLSKSSKRQVYDYFGFDLTRDGKLKGYPANISNGKKLAQIHDKKTKKVIETLRPYIDNYTNNNKISFRTKGCDKQTSEKLDKLFNDIIAVLPEFRTAIEKKQHRTQSYDVAKHSLKVIQHIVNDDNFQTLNNSDKKILFLAGLLHDITKKEGIVDKTHPTESAFNSFFITEKLQLTPEEKNKLYDLIKNHDWLEFTNDEMKTDRNHNPVETQKQAKSRSQKSIRDYAFNMRTSNTFLMQKILTKADLKSIKFDKSFYTKYENAFKKHSLEIEKEIETLQKTQPVLPCSKLPKASEIKDGPGVYRTKDGNVILKINEIEDFEALGFEKGTNKNNFKFLVHALDEEEKLSKFSSFAIVDSTALLSTSYVIKPNTEYRVFRPQGLIINTDTSNIHCGVNMDYGTGFEKDIKTLKDIFLFNGERNKDRKYFSDLIKTRLGLSDSEYIAFVKKYSNKSLSQIEAENNELAEKLSDVFNEIELGNRDFGRSYNEVLVTKPQISGVFLYDMNQPSNINNPTEFIKNELKNNSDNRQCLPALLKHAKENDLPVVVLGN